MACAQASLLNQMERALMLSRSPRFNNVRSPTTSLKLLPVRPLCSQGQDTPATTTTTTATPPLPPPPQNPKKSSALIAEPSRITLMDHWDPFSMSTRSLRQMMSVMDRIFGEISTPNVDFTHLRAPWDIMEDDDSYKMRIDLPGFEKDEVKVHIDDGVLIVSAEHKKESSDQEDKWSMRTHGSYRTRIALPKNIEKNKLLAKLNNGVLEVCIPKSKTEGQIINVKVE